MQEIEIRYRPARGRKPRVSDPESVFRLMHERVRDLPCERFYALYLVRLLDHIIIGGSRWRSLARQGVLK